MAKDINDSASVSAIIEKLDPEFGKMVEYIREIILASDERIGEQVKWNSPSFFYLGEMQPYDKKEYKRDIVVLNLRKGNAMLIFPTGERIKDDSGILTGEYTDGRRMVNFRSLNEVMDHAKDLQNVIRQWLEGVE